MLISTVMIKWLMLAMKKKQLKQQQKHQLQK